METLRTRGFSRSVRKKAAFLVRPGYLTYEVARQEVFEMRSGLGLFLLRWQQAMVIRGNKVGSICYTDKLEICREEREMQNCEESSYTDEKVEKA